MIPGHSIEFYSRVESSTRPEFVRAIPKNTTQSTQISKINGLIGEIISCNELSSRNVPALSAKCPGLKDSASWVKGTGSHGVLGEVNGTVQVDAGVRERSYGGDGKKAGNVVAG
nr:hypothetical protein [Tanacetum cinerariifolium]